MGKKELLLKELEQVPEPLLDEILDFVRFVKTRTVCEGLATYIASESSLKKDWLTPEEDAAWQKLQRKRKTMKFFITVFQDEDGMYVAECPAIPGCVSQGTTEEKALKNIRKAIKECLEVRTERGMPLTFATRQVEVVV